MSQNEAFRIVFSNPHFLIKSLQGIQESTQLLLQEGFYKFCSLGKFQYFTKFEIAINNEVKLELLEQL